MKLIKFAKLLIASLVICSAGLTPSAWAATAFDVEIVALDHWPIQNALKQTRKLLESYGGQIKITEMDAESSAGKARLKKSGIKGHIPVVIFVDGKYRHKVNGREVIFKYFPVDSESPMNIDGKWSAEDVKAVIEQKLNGAD